MTCFSDSSEGSCGDVEGMSVEVNDARTCMTFGVESLTVQHEWCQKQLDEIQKRKWS